MRSELDYGALRSCYPVGVIGRYCINVVWSTAASSVLVVGTVIATSWSVVCTSRALLSWLSFTACSHIWLVHSRRRREYSMKALELFGGCLSGSGGGFDCDMAFRKKVGRCSVLIRGRITLWIKIIRIEHSCDHVPQRVCYTARSDVKSSLELGCQMTWCPDLSQSHALPIWLHIITMLPGASLFHLIDCNYFWNSLESSMINLQSLIVAVQVGDPSANSQLDVIICLRLIITFKWKRSSIQHCIYGYLVHISVCSHEINHPIIPYRARRTRDDNVRGSISSLVRTSTVQSKLWYFFRSSASDRATSAVSLGSQIMGGGAISSGA